MAEKEEKSDALFVKSKVKEYLHSKECNAAGEVIDGGMLNDVMKEILDKAIDRAKGNGRKTVMGKDL